MATIRPIYLTVDDIEELLQWCEAQWDTPRQPTQWLWWRVQQACTRALMAAASDTPSSPQSGKQSVH
ncbi:MAG: hypothetical protein C7B47_14140 [Sulfobacillus thermosulfidooxidans]|uniref:Uncharacterized protein n=1 Tax=Sulfobacillus thermosulfidooxidans TaxID=28034 RepID=A0A2T2WR84_SULTH|nr:MAG: hypothetical protein C7B47_14140 [Sulfobacillus thermosulfidooxidans]